MKRFFNIFMFLALCIWNAFGQTGVGTDGYNPDNPGDPQVPEQKYILSLGISPNGVGSVNFNHRACMEGESIEVSAHSSNNYKFEKWTEGDSIVSLYASFYYDMPKRNVKLLAHFRYDPDSPNNPEPETKKYSITTKANPNKAGSFNFSRIELEEGAVSNIYAYANTYYDFDGWYKDGKLLSNNNPLNYVMGKENVVLEGRFCYNPSNPSSPSSNFWNKEIGLVIVDDFKPNYLISSIDEVIGGYQNRPDVRQIIVAGKMYSNDWGIANYFNNCAIIDLKRTYGYKEIPDYALDNCANLENIILPSCIENIGRSAFDGCTNLSEITCYAVTPPIVELNAFYGIPEGAVLHVLTSSIPLYSEAEGWKKFIILPLLDDVHTLSVRLPDESIDGRYKNLWLELTNKASGRTLKYVVSDRLLYTFNGLLEKESYMVVLKTPQGMELGRIDDILIGNDELEVSFLEIKQTKELIMKVLTPIGEDVTSKTNIIWFDENGKYLKQGSMLNQMTSGTLIKYQVSFDRKLGLVYQFPNEQEYVIQENNNDITLTLDSLPKKTIYGIVKDKNSVPIHHAVVTVSQKVNGEFMQSSLAKTDNKGKWSTSVFDAPLTLNYTADDYISNTVEVPIIGDSLDMGTCELRTITGAVIDLKLTYQSAQLSGSSSDKSEWYFDHSNIGYRIYNESKQKPIEAFNVQYPRIVLLEEVETGDCLKLTAYSIKNEFTSVDTEAVIDSDNSAEAIINIVGLGAIQADFASTENSNVAAILYNSDGDLIENKNYVNAKVSFNDLVKGKYTLVSMANSSLFNSISRLSQIKASGLVEGSDFIVNEVEVCNGLIQKVHNDVIPVLDESKLYYTGDKTSFTVNKPSITVGNYLTLASKIDFKEAYSGRVSDVKLIVDLPKDAEFVENSVMIGSKLAQYALDGQRITIALGSYYYDKVRFCVIPIVGGEFRSSAFVEFTVDGKTILQPVGSAYCAVKDLSISVPSVIAKNELTVSGTAMAHSHVTIYDGNQIIGETEALGNGQWSNICKLDNPYNLSIHNIFAKVLTKSGYNLRSDSKDCLYDINTIEVSKVTMLNQSDRGEAVTVFDFLNPVVSIPAYRYYPRYPKFTFLIDFTNNDRTKVSNVMLYVKTSKGNKVPLRANFDGNKKLWIATGEFGDWGNYDIPANVSVKYDYFTSFTEESLESTFRGIAETKRNNNIEVVLNDSTNNESFTFKNTFLDSHVINKYNIKSLSVLPSEELRVDSISENLVFYYSFNFVQSEFTFFIPQTSIKYMASLCKENLEIISWAENVCKSNYIAITASINDISEKARMSNLKKVKRCFYSYNTIRKAANFTRNTESKISELDDLSSRIDALGDCEYMDESIRENCRDAVDRLFNDFFNISLTSNLMQQVPGGPTNPAATVSFAGGWLNFAAEVGYSTQRRRISNFLAGFENVCPPPPPTDDGRYSGNPDVEGIHDPAGYVYEAVHSNRVEGVTASCYYKEYVEDMYGDKHENIVLWNAEDYAQKNPLFTDENGMYRWDVPQGLWQVKFEKEGYQTAYSEWLPVPPPQLEVNIPITQLSQPSVKNARAYEDGIEIHFNKYMDPSTLSLDNIKVLKKDSCISGKVNFEDIEKIDEKSDSCFVSKIRFVPDSTFLSTDKVTLVVSRMVKSYAGIPMTEDYTQEFDIVREVKEIAVDSLYEVAYGKERTITVSVLPSDAAIGKKITATSSSTMISTVTSEVVLDENSQASFVITGELPGTTMINFSIEDVSVKGQSIINVVTKIEQPNVPTASRASGTEVFRNTAIELYSDIKDAKIFYTLDGSCPCEAGALIYTKPIVIENDVTIKAMVVDKDGNESEVAVFKYRIKRTNLGIDVAEGWSWISQNMESPLDVHMFDGKVERIQSQTREAINDPNYGLVGDLLELNATEAYKVNASKKSQLVLNDYQFNARDNHITLEKGWNWIGYPMSQTMTVDEAFVKAIPSIGDIVVGLSGQAEFTGDKWTGNLNILVPGHGYMYKASDKMEFSYNTDIVSKAASLYAVTSNVNVAPWVADVHAYPNVMPMTVLMHDAEDMTDDKSYYLGAFAGSECRGIGTYVDERWFITVHGNENEIITFKAIDKFTEEIYDVRESLPFVADNVGSYTIPFDLHFGNSTGIGGVCSDNLVVSPLVAEYNITVSLQGSEMDKVSIFSAYGEQVMLDSNCGTKSVINVSNLSSGVYIVTVVADNKFYYKKFTKK